MKQQPFSVLLIAVLMMISLGILFLVLLAGGMMAEFGSERAGFSYQIMPIVCSVTGTGLSMLLIRWFPRQTYYTELRVISIFYVILFLARLIFSIVMQESWIPWDRWDN